MPRSTSKAIALRAARRKRDREKALELVKGGTPKREVARIIGTHQKTVQRWCKPYEAAMSVKA